MLDCVALRIFIQGWGGASGHDAPLIAYDALLFAPDNWEEVCLRGILHGGDNDSTGKKKTPRAQGRRAACGCFLLMLFTTRTKIQQINAQKVECISPI